MASKPVATTVFASTAKGGLLALVGLGKAAATPVGWNVAAAVITAGAYYGVTRLFRRLQGQKVDVIPRFINTPLDPLGASLFDLMGALAVRLGHIDGRFDEAERAAIVGIFVEEWGYDRSYVDQALTVLAAGRRPPATGRQGDRPGPGAVPGRQPRLQPGGHARRDDRPAAPHRGGRRDVDEREDLAIEAVEVTMKAETALSLRNARRAVGGVVAQGGGRGAAGGGAAAVRAGGRKLKAG